MCILKKSEVDEQVSSIKNNRTVDGKYEQWGNAGRFYATSQAKCGRLTCAASGEGWCQTFGCVHALGFCSQSKVSEALLEHLSSLKLCFTLRMGFAVCVPAISVGVRSPVSRQDPGTNIDVTKCACSLVKLCISCSLANSLKKETEFQRGKRSGENSRISAAPDAKKDRKT